MASCGRKFAGRKDTGRHPKILNGKAAGQGEYPWQISLQKKSREHGSQWSIFVADH